jgi:hypothetical protein
MSAIGKLVYNLMGWEKLDLHSDVNFDNKSDYDSREGQKYAFNFTVISTVKCLFWPEQASPFATDIHILFVVRITVAHSEVS